MTDLRRRLWQFSTMQCTLFAAAAAATSSTTASSFVLPLQRQQRQHPFQLQQPICHGHCRGGVAKRRHHPQQQPNKIQYSSRRRLSATAADSTTGITIAVSDPVAALGPALHATLEHLVRKRSQARQSGDYRCADALLKEIHNSIMHKHNQFRVAIRDIPRQQGGGSEWSLQYCCTSTKDDNDDATATSANGSSKNQSSRPSILNCAHSALGMAVSLAEQPEGASSLSQTTNSNHHVVPPTHKLQGLVDAAVTELERWNELQEMLQTDPRQFEQRFLLTRRPPETSPVNDNDSRCFESWKGVEHRMTGRKAADTAFWFAMAGISDPRLYELLVRVCTKEIRRWGKRESCQAKHLLAIETRLAASGVTRQEAPGFVDALREALRSKDSVVVVHQDDNDDDWLDLHSDRCALLIWKFSTRQRKQRSFLKTAAKHWELHYGGTRRTDSTTEPNPGGISKNTIDRSIEWQDMFADCTQDLVVDIGCGMGVSLLGLRKLGDYQKSNMLGVDLSSLGIGYARGLCHRSNQSERMAFVHMPAQDLVEQLHSYPGRLAQVLIQFPTPYRLDTPDTNTGNSQLPDSATDGFMVTRELFESLFSVLSDNARDGGELILQSNCEDVAVYMRNLAVQVGFVVQQIKSTTIEAETVTEDSTEITQRTKKWISMGGERAEGPEWQNGPILPRHGRTETEIACILNKTPVHRVILRTGI